MAQVSSLSPPADTCGATILLAMATLSIEEQPLVGCVVVSRYHPAAFTVGVAVLAPDTIPIPDQAYCAIAVGELPSSAREVMAQVSVSAFPASAPGAVRSSRTTRVS